MQAQNGNAVLSTEKQVAVATALEEFEKRKHAAASHDATATALQQKSQATLECLHLTTEKEAKDFIPGHAGRLPGQGTGQVPSQQAYIRQHGAQHMQKQQRL